jgi:DNA-binding LytR/AlgR family response regulator
MQPKYFKKREKMVLKEAEQNIICLIADSNYTNLIFETGQSKLTACNLAVYDALLPSSFLRVNRSCTINKQFIKKFNFHERLILLTNNTEIPISRRRWLFIKEKLKK